MNTNRPIRLLLLALLAFVLVLPASAQSPAEYKALNNSNIRSQPSVGSQIVGVLKRGEQITVMGSAKNGTWFEVKLGNGEAGYIYGRLLRPVESTTASDQTNTQATAPQQTTSTPAATPAEDSGLSVAPENASVYFISPYDNETIAGGQFWIRFGLRNMGIAPAGIEKQYTGHHHLLVNTGLPAMDESIPSDDNHIHFGRGQTEYFVELPPGTHTLQLLLGDHDHIPHSPPVMSKQITIIVP